MSILAFVINVKKQLFEHCLPFIFFNVFDTSADILQYLFSQKMHKANKNIVLSV